MQVRKAVVGVGLSVAACAAFAALVGVTAFASRTVSWRPQSVPSTIVAPRRSTALPASLQLEGSVLDMGAAAYGTMTVRVGNATTTTTPVSLPLYQLTLPLARPDDMVSIELQAPGFRYTSILGTYRRLARLAGSDARLTVGELDRLRLTPFSTALAFFLHRDLGGLDPSSDVAHELALRSVATGDIATAVSMLTAVSDGLVALPAGVADGVALLGDRGAYRAFLAQHPEINDHAAALERAPGIPIARGSLPHKAWLSSPMPTSPTQVFGPYGQILVTTATGYELHAFQTRRSVPFAGAFADGGMQLVPRDPVFLGDSFPFIQLVPNQPSPQVRERTELVGESYRQVFVGDKFRMWLATQDVRVSYPDYPQVAPEERRRPAGVFVVSDLERTGSRFEPEALVGQHALPLMCRQGNPVQLVSCEYALHNFYAGGNGVTENVGQKVDANLQPIGVLGGSSFQWRHSRHGFFELLTPAINITYWRLDGGNGAVTQLAYLATSRDGDDTLTLAGATAMITSDGSGGFAQLPADGDWDYASFRQTALSVYAYDAGTFPVSTVFRRHADGKAVRLSRSLDPAYADQGADSNTRSGWRILDGRLYDTRYRANVSAYNDPTDCTGVACYGYSSCEAAFAVGATQCAPQQVRYFRPLARVGNGLFGIEELYTTTGSSYSPPYVFVRSSRANHHGKL